MVRIEQFALDLSEGGSVIDTKKETRCQIGLAVVRTRRKRNAK